MRSDEIDIKLMTWGSIRITLDELIIALRHRLVVITYFICWAGVYPIRFRPDVPYLDVWREILIFLLSQAVIILSLPVMVGLVARAQRHRPLPTVYISLVVLLATQLGCFLIVGCFWAFTGVLQVDPVTIFIYGVLHLVLTELVGALVMTFFLPTILTDIRLPPRPEPRDTRLALAEPASVGSPVLGLDIDDAPATGPEVGPATPPGARGAAEVVIGGKKVPKHQLRVIRAAGNYLDVTLQADKLFVQATMRSVLQQMEGSDGLLLHRSLWLAVGELESFQRQGVDILVHTRDGETVKTARSRQSEVLAWLKQHAIPRRNPSA